MTKVEKRVYLTPKEVELVNEQLADAGNSFSSRVAYAVREQLQREAIQG